MKAKSMKTLLLVLAASLLALSPAAAQQPADQGAATKDTLGPSADTIKPYRPAGRDPFRKEIKPKPGSKNAKVPKAVGFPPLEARRAEFRQKVQQSHDRDVPEPNPVSQYLVAEVDITGVFQDDAGAGAFVKAHPTGTMFFVRRGDRLYNGEIIRIDSDDSDSGGAKVLFREKSYLELNGKQTEQERVVAKVPGASTSARK
jgi:hypothetical protein